MEKRQISQVEKRRFDALKRGFHRIAKDDSTPVAVHVLGLGKAGADVIAEMLRDGVDDLLEDTRVRFTALAIDTSDEHMAPIRELAGNLPADQAQVRTCALQIPSRDELFAMLRRYREYLKLEYPRYYWNPNYEPWLPADIEMPKPGEHVPRALAKAIYGHGYYNESRPLLEELNLFAQSVEAADCKSVVCVVFGLGGGTGSGMVVDLARHLSNVRFGRRSLVLGVGIAPCDGDPEEVRGSQLFPALNELDCMLDQDKNEGVIQVWGDLYRNPFTAGFIMVPQQPAWESTGNLQATHQRVDREIAGFLTGNKGTDLWETLRLLNWIGAPPTQHAAARTQYGERWIHMLGYGGLEKGVSASRLGLKDSYKADFLEMRVAVPEGANLDSELAAVAGSLNQIFEPVNPPEVVRSKSKGDALVQYVLPRVKKTDLQVFHAAREDYDQLSWTDKLMVHSWLLDLGVLLCEPALRFEGMAGECLWGCACWIVVPYEAIRGEELPQAVL